MFRQLPPTATPISLADLRSGVDRHSGKLIRFQEALRRQLGVQVHGLASSGRTALYALLKGLAKCRGYATQTDILLPAYTCPALVKVILDVGLRPRLVDILPQTLTFNWDQLAALIGEQTLAVICVHPFGIPQDLEVPLQLANKVGAVVIEDAAQALGSRLRGQFVGTHGDFSLFSLGPGKPLSTAGGGILCVREANSFYARSVKQVWNDEIAPPSPLASGWALLRLMFFALAFHPLGWWLVTRGKLHRIGNSPSSWGYRRDGLTEAQAGVGLKLLERLELINRQRRENADRLIARLQDLDVVCIPQVVDAAEPIYLRLPVLVDDERRRERLFRRLSRAEIGVGRMYERPLSEIFPSIAEGSYLGANQVARRLLTLPTHHYLTDADVQHIAQIIESEANHYREIDPRGAGSRPEC